MNWMSSVCRLGLVAFTILFIFSTSTSAQDYRAKIQGLVTDQANAAVPNATVVLKNISTGVGVLKQSF